MELNLKNRFQICFHLIIHLVPVLPVKDSAWYLGIDPDLVIPDKRLSVYEGAWLHGKEKSWVSGKINFIKAAKKFNFPVHKPIIDLTKEQYKTLWEGNEYAEGINDFFKEVEQNLYKVQYRVLLSRYRGEQFAPNAKVTASKRSIIY